MMISWPVIALNCWFCGGKGTQRTMTEADFEEVLSGGQFDSHEVECFQCKGAGTVSLLTWLEETWHWRIKLPLIIWYDLNFNDDADSEGGF